MPEELLDPPSRSPDELVRRCGGYSKAVAKVSDFGRALWELAFLEDLRDSIHLSDDKYQHSYQIIDIDRLQRGKYRHDRPLLNFFLDLLRIKGLSSVAKDPKYAGYMGLDTAVFDPTALVRHFLGGLKEEHELQYFVRRDIKRRYRRNQSSQMAHFFHLLANAINKALDKGGFVTRIKTSAKRGFVTSTEDRQAEGEVGNDTSGRGIVTSTEDSREPSLHCDYKSTFLPEMLKVLRDDQHWKSESERVWADGEASQEPEILKMFIECCRDVGYLRADQSKRGHIHIRAQVIDAEYLISRLFGMPTGISAFDGLFGGGGLILSEDLEADTDTGEQAEERLNGRTILIKGRFGTGKSLLSMQLAVEVARKGGLAWIMPQEQNAEECLYTLESMAVLPRDDSVFVAKTLDDALKALYDRDDERGALIICGVVPQDSYEDFLSAFAENAKRMRRYPLRMISVDPINSVSIRDRQQTDLRAFVVEKLREIRKFGTNVLLVSEEGSSPENELHFEQNIADTVIHLSINKQQQHNNYAQRYFEITKSRFQREQRGEHAFSIVPGTGFRIFPSTAAVGARMYTRGARIGADNIEVEPPSLTEALRLGSVIAGDVIVFQGPSGTFKTPLGVPFLLGSDKRKPEREERSAETSPDEAVPMPNPNVPLIRKSLFVATRDNKPTIQRMLREFEGKYLKDGKSTRRAKKSLADIIIRPLRQGYVQPGYILQSLKDEFDKAKVERYFIDRVMVDNIAHWEMSCPFIRDDEAFGNTLLDFLRRHKVTSLVICDEPSRDARSVLQQSIVDNADCVLRFSRSESAGQQHIFMRVIKTHNIEAHKDYFELIRADQEIRFQHYFLKEGEGS